MGRSVPTLFVQNVRPLRQESGASMFVFAASHVRRITGIPGCGFRGSRFHGCRGRFLIAVVFCSLALPLSVHVCAQDVPEQQEEVEQRELLRRIEETQELLQNQKWLEATERFDEAWQLACDGDDAVLNPLGAGTVLFTHLTIPPTRRG